MTYGRATVPAVAGALLLTALLWWAGASVNALHLQGTAQVLGPKAVADLEYWLNPWSYDPPESVRLGTLAQGGTGSRLPRPVRDRDADPVRRGLRLLRAGGAAPRPQAASGAPEAPATLLALWAWGMVAGTLAVTVSAPWMIASQGRGSYRFLPQLVGMMTAGRQILVLLALVAAVVTVLIARITAKGAGELPRAVVPARAARVAATVGTLVVAVSLVVLSYQPVAARIQTVSLSGALLSEPGDFLRQWLLLGGWAGPAGTSIGDWLLYRAADGLLLAVVWCALRWLPGLLTRATVAGDGGRVGLRDRHGAAGGPAAADGGGLDGHGHALRTGTRDVGPRYRSARRPPRRVPGGRARGPDPAVGGRPRAGHRRAGSTARGGAGPSRRRMTRPPAR